MSRKAEIGTPSGSRRSRESRLALAAAAVTAFVVVSFLVMSTSRAAFSSQTSNTGNSVASGSVILTDDDAGSAMFAINGATPGPLGASCIKVNYTGTTTPSQPVRLYSSGALTGTGLGPYVDLTVEVGTGGTFASCTGFVPSSTLYTGTIDAFATTQTSFAASISTTWTPPPSTNRTFRFTLALQNNNAAQNKTVGFGYTWEAQS